MTAPGPPGRIREPAPAKINLTLQITGRRPDGYHLLDSLIVFADEIADTVALRPADTFSLAITGRFAGALDAGPDNLVLRAARSLAEAVPARPGGGGAAITLEKNLPVASGIGGGSADAAATLRALGRAWDVDPAIAASRALALGADVPVCLGGRSAIMRGIGELLSPPPPLPPFGLLLANPAIAVPTGAVFARAGTRGWSGTATWPPGGWGDFGSLCRDLRGWANDLEAAAIEIAPPIGDVLAALRTTAGCGFARMSGSGATCVGLYPDRVTADRAMATLARDTRWWLATGSAGGT